MSEPLLWVVFACYLGVSVDLAVQSKMALSLVFGGYALAQIGMIWVARA